MLEGDVRRKCIKRCERKQIKEDLQICLCEMLNHQFIVFFLPIKNIEFCAATGLEPAISRL